MESIENEMRRMEICAKMRIEHMEMTLCRVGEFPGQKIAKDVRDGRRMKYKVCKKTLKSLKIFEKKTISLLGVYICTIIEVLKKFYSNDVLFMVPTSNNIILLIQPLICTHNFSKVAGLTATIVCSLFSFL